MSHFCVSISARQIIKAQEAHKGKYCSLHTVLLFGPWFHFRWAFKHPHGYFSFIEYNEKSYIFYLKIAFFDYFSSYGLVKACWNGEHCL